MKKNFHKYVQFTHVLKHGQMNKLNIFIITFHEHLSQQNKLLNFPTYYQL